MTQNGFGLSAAADALAAVRELLDASSVVAFIDTPTGDVALIADEDGVGVAAHGELVPLKGRP